MKLEAQPSKWSKLEAQSEERLVLVYVHAGYVNGMPETTKAFARPSDLLTRVRIPDGTKVRLKRVPTGILEEGTLTQDVFHSQTGAHPVQELYVNHDGTHEITILELPSASFVNNVASQDDQPVATTQPRA